MGTLFRVAVYAQDEVAGYAAIRLAFQRAHALDAKLSDYKADSELSELMREGNQRPFRASDDLFRVLKAAQRLAKETQGAFDITIGPLSQLWRESRDQKLLPSPERLAEARRRVGYRLVELRPRNEVRLRRSGLQLDLGGIAKGFAADEMLTVLSGRGFPNALVVAGGEVAAGAAMPDRCGWRVSLAGADPLQEHASAVTVKNCGISTSGRHFQNVTIGGISYSHIVNPLTGLGLTDNLTASIIAPTAMESDSLATAASVLGFDGAMALFNRRPSVEWQLQQTLECTEDTRGGGPRGVGRGCGRTMQSPQWPAHAADDPTC